MNRKIRWITETAVMLALLVSLQALTKPFGQLVTGSFVNAVLAVTALYVGMSGGIVVALISPVLAYLLQIAPQPLTVPAIMAGNAAYVAVLCAVAGTNGKQLLRSVLAWLSAAAVKFGILYGLVVWLLCGVLADGLLEAGLLKAPMLTVLSTSFSWMQLFTALIGGGVALLVVPPLRKALKQ